MGSYTILATIVQDSQKYNSILSIISNVSNNYFISQLGVLLRDDIIKSFDINKQYELINLLIAYYDKCASYILFDEGIDKLVNSARLSIYHVNTYNGLRVATKNEIESGVLGLTVVEEYPIGEDKYKLLNLLLWTMTGKLVYYRQAGYQYEYDDKLGLLNSFYELLSRAYDSLIRMLDWAGNNNEFNRDIQILKLKAKNKYKYPEYAADEIKETLSIKQLIFNLKNTLPKKSDDKRYKKAWAIVLSNETKINKLNPLDIAFLREIYYELTSNITKLEESLRIKKENEINKLKRECEYLIESRDKGLIDGKHFAFKIIETLQKINYSKCSDKQYAIIKEALEIVENSTIKDKEIHDKFDIADVVFEDTLDNPMLDDGIFDISNLLGNGSLDDY